MSTTTSASNVTRRSFIVAIYSSYNYKHKILSRVPNCSQLCGYYRDYTYLNNLATTVFGTRPLSRSSDKELFCRDMFIVHSICIQRTHLCLPSFCILGKLGCTVSCGFKKFLYLYFVRIVSNPNRKSLI